MGQRVLRGERIACTESIDGADVHAPTAGRIAAIETSDVPLSAKVSQETCIVIDTDDADRAVRESAIQPGATHEERLRQITTAGIVGLGGATYPTAAKIRIHPDSGSQLLIINGAECEPYISCDDMLMREAPEEIIQGAEIVRQLVDAAKCTIAIERDKPQAIEAVTAAADRLDIDGLSIAELPSIYPAGGERQLIEVLAGVEVPSASLPGDVGFLCQNVGTAYAVYKYFRQGEPLCSRIVTVTGSAVAEPQNVEAMIGTPIADLIAACGGYRSRAARLIHGGSMMGYALDNDSLPITKATNCIIAAEPGEIHQDHREWPCIRCSECSVVCPVRLQPQELILAARKSNSAALAELSLSECIECGCCDVVCPSHIPLTQTFHDAMPLVRNLGQQQSLSAASDQRFQQRKQRQHDTLAADTRRRKKIKGVLDDESQRTERIKAAVERARQKKTETNGS